MNRTIRYSDRLEGTVSTAGDKSISHRAALLNSIADGTAHVSNFCVGDDRTSMLGCLQGLGVKITECSDCDMCSDEDCFEVAGVGLNGLQEPSDVLYAGNSGTTTRLVAGLLAGQSFLSVLTGDDSLRSRPMGRIVDPLREMGAGFMGRNGDTLLPLSVRGGDLNAIEYDLKVASAQVKSAILIAGLYANGRTVVRSPGQSRDHTERMMRYMGADVDIDGLSVSVQTSNLTATNVRVPGDISSAAFWMVAGAAHPNASIRLNNVGINPSRTGVIEVLQSMGASLRMENVVEDKSEPAADIIVESSDLRGVEIAGDIIPQLIDELPVLALAAARAKGETVIRDAEELRVKESDRITATVKGLAGLGADIEEISDGMVIRGGRKLRGTDVRSFGDHRIAMTMGIAGTISDGETSIDEADAADVSYPTFWRTLESVSGPSS
ncbi:MAG: 3-phosphoshikimate 1-carboxyvinyltransferase [Dehalococcoidia bacterium]|nr:3-phosphoshikimate 1-carboxyvinyltransferase [Dehalococcoidia bacterium]